jgi:hypothetical protein
MKAAAIICFTIWLIATEKLILDLIEFSTRVELLEQIGRMRPQGAPLPTETFDHL